MPKAPASEFDPDAIVDQLYDIALAPESLDRFIDVWNAAGLDAREARETIERIDRFDTTYRAHLARAQTFLDREDRAAQGAGLEELLAPFAALAAFIVDRQMRVVACNEGARAAFGIAEGVGIGDARIAIEAAEAVREALDSVFSAEASPDRLFKIENADKRGATLFQIRRLPERTPGATARALIVTTQYHWQEALGDTLEEVFDLTSAEQGVVRALVEGKDARAISAERGTSEGTVRGQIKSILGKMNARSQSEVIRLVLSLRDVSGSASPEAPRPTRAPALARANWLEAEVWKPFRALHLPDGRKLDYHVMGPADGAPVLYSHMGYCLVRWHEPMLRLAYQHNLRIVCPIRAGYGHSDPLDPQADILETTRNDTLALLAELGIARLPYVTQGNDLIFAADFGAHHPEIVSEIVGLCARPSLPGDRHYAGMGKWHRFFLSTAKHAPHLLKFTSRAAVTMARRIGVREMFRQMNQRSPADLAVTEDEALLPVLVSNAELIAGKTTDVSGAYTMEILATESPWSHLMNDCAGIPTWFVNGGEDPATDIATITEYREFYPWIDIEVIPNGGQMLIYQHFETLIPRIAEAARRA